MSVDVFGHHINRGSVAPNIRGIGFKLTVDGQYDLSDKRLCNVAEPRSVKDAVTLEFLQHAIESKLGKLEQILQEIREQVHENAAYCDQLDERIARFEQ